MNFFFGFLLQSIWLLNTSADDSDGSGLPGPIAHGHTVGESIGLLLAITQAGKGAPVGLLLALTTTE